MALIEASNIVQLSEKDMQQACFLSEQAGWNQTEQDWAVFFRHGLVFGVKPAPDQLVATAAIIPYGDKIAWISMVLTKVEWRGRGLGTTLLKHCLQWTEAQSRTAFLDATPAGEPIYRALGFVPSFKITRWQGFGGNAFQNIPSINIPTDAIKTANLAFGADRSFLLENFNKRYPTAKNITPSTPCFVRNGHLAWQIGPVVSQSETEGAACIDSLIRQLSGAVFIDILDDCAIIAQHLVSLGFEKQRTFLRMQKGSYQLPQAHQTLAIAGPEFG